MTEPEVFPTKPVSESQPLVYVVDDEAMLLELVTAILRPLGCQIVTFVDPESALNAFSRAQPRPDLLITDYAMHHLNGMELIRECRRIDPLQKILLLSGTVGVEVFNGQSCQPDKFLAKPYRAPQLVELVRQILSS